MPNTARKASTANHTFTHQLNHALHQLTDQATHPLHETTITQLKQALTHTPHHTDIHLWWNPRTNQTTISIPDWINHHTPWTKPLQAITPNLRIEYDWTPPPKQGWINLT